MQNSKKEKLTYRELHRVLNYDSLTGIFKWKVRVKRSHVKIKVGDIAGYKTAIGYLEISIRGKAYLSHRLAWFYVYGYIPENGLDHRDRIRHHNWIANLREATQICNMRNTGNLKNNTSGVKGVSKDKRRNKWESYIWIDSKKYGLGSYKEFSDAVCARLAGEQCLDWSNCDSNSPAYLYVKENIQGEI